MEFVMKWLALWLTCGFISAVMVTFTRRNQREILDGHVNSSASTNGPMNVLMLFEMILGPLGLVLELVLTFKDHSWFKNFWSNLKETWPFLVVVAALIALGWWMDEHKATPVQAIIVMVAAVFGPIVVLAIFKVHQDRRRA
jgi:hypothetical protein